MHDREIEGNRDNWVKWDDWDDRAYWSDRDELDDQDDWKTGTNRTIEMPGS